MSTQNIEGIQSNTSQNSAEKLPQSWNGAKKKNAWQNSAKGESFSLVLTVWMHEIVLLA